MGRRKNQRRVANVDGERSSIGDYVVDQACIELDAFARKQMAAFHPKRFTVSTVVAMLFSPDTIGRAAAARGIILPRYTTKTYEVLSDAALTLTYQDHTPVPPIEASKIEPQSTLHEMVDHIADLRVIYEQYARVKHMLRWFNRGATAGAIRNYWPAVMHLCPRAACFAEMYDKAPERYATPSGIAQMLPLIRDTAGTVAVMALAPQGEVHHDIGVTLTFRTTKGKWEGIEINYPGLNITL